MRVFVYAVTKFINIHSVTRSDTRLLFFSRTIRLTLIPVHVQIDLWTRLNIMSHNVIYESLRNSFNTYSWVTVNYLG